MDKKDIDAVYNLMQNVSNKLGDISNKIEVENQKNSESEIQNILKKQETAIGYLVHLTNGFEKVCDTKKDTINKYNEYVLFGKDSPMNSRLLFILASLILSAWLGFKYLVPVISNQEKLELENVNYRMMYEYLYLKDLRDERSNYPIEKLAKQVENRNTNFLKEYNQMVSQHKIIKRRMELENELERLK